MCMQRHWKQNIIQSSTNHGDIIAISNIIDAWGGRATISNTNSAWAWGNDVCAAVKNLYFYLY